MAYAHQHTRLSRATFDRPGHTHTPRYPADVLELDSPLCRVRGLDRGPAQWETDDPTQNVAARRHLDGPLIRSFTGEYVHPAVMGQDPRPILDLGGQIEDHPRISPDVAADRRVHYWPLVIDVSTTDRAAATPGQAAPAASRRAHCPVRAPVVAAAAGGG